MTEDIKGLISKIQQDGVQAAEAKAKTIEDAARKEAQIILEKAQSEADKLILEAKQKINSMQESSLASLTQASRDAVLNLKTEINNLLKKIMVGAVKEALAPQELARMIQELVKAHAQEASQIIIELKEEDAQALRDSSLGHLKEELKKGLTLKISDEIQGGFIISFDSGKSQFDFTDNSLAEYLSAQVKPGLAKLLSEAF